MVFSVLFCVTAGERAVGGLPVSSKGYLSSLFSEEVGISIQAFLQRMRIEEACRLLINTDLSMAEISTAVGYQDTRHFSKVFRRYQVVSPREYRKNAEADK